MDYLEMRCWHIACAANTDGWGRVHHPLFGRTPAPLLRTISRKISIVNAPWMDEDAGSANSSRTDSASERIVPDPRAV